MKKAYCQQDCRYCLEPAVASLTYNEKEYVPVCWGHEVVGRQEIRKLGYGVTDMVAIDNRTAAPGGDDKLARALQPAPTYPAATAESRFGLRVDAKRAAAAVAEATPAEISPNSPNIKRVSEPGKDLPTAFLQALGTDWRNLRATRVHSNRITVSIDDQKYTVYTRRG